MEGNKKRSRKQTVDKSRKSSRITNPLDKLMSEDFSKKKEEEEKKEIEGTLDDMFTKIEEAEEKREIEGTLDDMFTKIEEAEAEEKRRTIERDIQEKIGAVSRLDRSDAYDKLIHLWYQIIETTIKIIKSVVEEWSKPPYPPEETSEERLIHLKMLEKINDKEFIEKELNFLNIRTELNGLNRWIEEIKRMGILPIDGPYYPDTNDDEYEYLKRFLKHLCSFYDSLFWSNKTIEDFTIPYDVDPNGEKRMLYSHNGIFYNVDIPPGFFPRQPGSEGEIISVALLDPSARPKPANYDYWNSMFNFKDLNLIEKEYLFLNTPLKGARPDKRDTIIANIIINAIGASFLGGLKRKCEKEFETEKKRKEEMKKKLSKIEELRIKKEVGSLHLKDLEKNAETRGVDTVAIKSALREDNPKASLIDLIVAAEVEVAVQKKLDELEELRKQRGDEPTLASKKPKKPKQKKKKKKKKYKSKKKSKKIKN